MMRLFVLPNALIAMLMTCSTNSFVILNWHRWLPSTSPVRGTRARGSAGITSHHTLATLTRSNSRSNANKFVRLDLTNRNINGDNDDIEGSTASPLPTPNSMMQSEVFFDTWDSDVEGGDESGVFRTTSKQTAENRNAEDGSNDNGSRQQQEQDQSSLTPSFLKQLVQDDDVRYADNQSLDQVGAFFFNQQSTFTVDDAIRLIPFIMPVVAYVSYDDIASSFAWILEILANRNFVPVDGGAYQAKIIAPAVNGIVIPAISLLFANLIATTVTTLRQRQLDIRYSINMEASQLRILNSMISNFPSPKARMQCWSYLSQYTSRLIAESQPTVNVDSLDSSFDSELNGLLNEFNRISYMNYDDDDTEDDDADDLQKSSSRKSQQRKQREEIPGSVLGTCFNSCTALYEQRSKRITALRSLFPPLHFVIVANLALSILIAFLLESDQVLLVFLNAVQLKILWTMLVGTFSALAIVCYDLGNPFRGSYQISKSVKQLYTIRLTLRASIENINNEQ